MDRIVGRNGWPQVWDGLHGVTLLKTALTCVNSAGTTIHISLTRCLGVGITICLSDCYLSACVYSCLFVYSLVCLVSVFVRLCLFPCCDRLLRLVDILVIVQFYVCCFLLALVFGCLHVLCTSLLTLITCHIFCLTILSYQYGCLDDCDQSPPKKTAITIHTSCGQYSEGNPAKPSTKTKRGHNIAKLIQYERQQ